MSIDEFLDKLAKQASLKGWFVDSYGRIRCGPKNHRQCPITSFRDKSIWHLTSVSEEIGLSADDALEVVKASDVLTSCYDPVLRQKLLAAVGWN